MLAAEYTRDGAVDHFDSCSLDTDGIYTAFSTDCHAFSAGDAPGVWTVRSGKMTIGDTKLYGTVQLVPVVPAAGLVSLSLPLLIFAARRRGMTCEGTRGIV